MRQAIVGLLALGLVGVGCTSEDGGSKDGAGGSPRAGTSSSGGATGGAVANGGAPGASGAPATGATPGASGTSATGGTPTGGRTASGGNRATGGARTNGGVTETGGVAETGGAEATGGVQTTGGAPGTGICGANEGQLFGPEYPWNRRVDQAPLDSESEAIISYLQANHTGGQRFRIDGPSEQRNSLYGITILTAGESTPLESFSPSEDFYSPDCDPAPIPVPEDGAIEGESGYSCESDGDCHLIVIDPRTCRLHEMWRADRRSASNFDGGCQAVWDLSAAYEQTLRGDCCTSADAAGLPIAAHMVTADEVAGGEIRHALRFILPNSLMRERIYVRPGTHSTGATSGPSDAPPYAARMRLRADFDDGQLNAAARIVARALQEYGMILSDGGNITFTFANDRFTTAKWADVGLGPNDLTSLEWTDFEVVDMGDRHTWDGSCDCNRSPIAE